MNVVLTSPWAQVVAIATALTALGGIATVIIRAIQTAIHSFSDLMKTLEDDNQKLRDALNQADASRVELSNQLVQIHTEVAATITTHSNTVLNLQQEIAQYRQSNLQMLSDIANLKMQLAESIRTIEALRQQIAEYTKINTVSPTSVTPLSAQSSSPISSPTETPEVTHEQSPDESNS